MDVIVSYRKVDVHVPIYYGNIIYIIYVLANDSIAWIPVWSV